MSFKPIICALCRCSFIPGSSSQKHCSWECRFVDIFPRSTPDNQCWLWPRSTNVVSGYGQFIKSGKPLVCDYAHRISYSLRYNVELGPKDVVMHKCDNPACFNPSHLERGTQKDNLNDMRKKGRNTKDFSNFMRGESHKNAKMTNELVLKIRTQTNERRADVARQHKVSETLIGRIWDRTSWKHI